MNIYGILNIAPSKGVRTKDWKYFRYVDDKSIEELYNLNDDPRETNNLNNNKEHKVVTNNLRNKLEKLIEKYKDPYQLNPTNASLKDTKFSWNVSNEIQEQTAYQFLVASSKEKVDNNIWDVWNSGKF